MSLCPADMSAIHAPDEDGACLNCDAVCPCLPGAPRHAHLAGGYASDGCYICQPNNPDAAEEGCEKCDRDYWAHVLAPTNEDYRAAGIVLNPKAL